MHQGRDEERRLTMRGRGPAAFSRRRRKGIKDRQKVAFNGSGPTMPGRGSCAPSSLCMYVDLPCIGIAFRRAGIIRLRRSSLLLLLLLHLLSDALLPAYCEKTAFSTLEVATRRGLKLITVTTVDTAIGPLGVGGHRPMHLTQELRVRAPPGGAFYAISHIMMTISRKS